MSKPALTIPVFVTVDKILPGSTNHNVIVKALSVQVVREYTRSLDDQKFTIGEALVGDATGSILLSLRNEQVASVVAGQVYTIRNAKVDMFKGHMRLVADRWGLIEHAGALTGDVNTANNLSDTEYELVNTPEQ